MGTPGPKPAPTASKKLAGTRKDRINAAEPIIPQGLPVAPASLPPDAAEHWSTIVSIFAELHILSPSDGPALSLYCVTYATWLEASKTLAREKVLVKTPSGIIRAHPALKIQQESARDLLRILAEFGGTPSSRSRLRISNESKQVDPLDEFL